MLRPDVQRLQSAAILLLALLTLGQLTLHQHSLIPEAGNAALLCSVCAFSADNVTSAVPLAFTLVVTAFLPSAIEIFVAPEIPLARSSRAPPQV